MLRHLVKHCLQRNVTGGVFLTQHVRRPLTTSVCQCLRSPDISENLRTTEEVAPVVRDRSLPIITSRRLEYMPASKEPKQTWLESLTTVEDEKLGILDLHPDIFATYPRLDILWWNVYWQQTYKKIRYDVTKNRAEMPGGGRKPWPQKGTGRARHGSIRSPLWLGGGKSFGPRGPQSYFFMLSYSMRSLGLRVALSCKYSQESLHVVDSLDIPTDDPEYLKDLVESRGWGLSVLFVDDTDIMPQNITLATDEIKPYNLMPVYGLNVHSILKHETIVLTLRAVEKLEDKLLQQMHKSQRLEPTFKRMEWAANHAQRKGPGLW